MLSTETGKVVVTTIVGFVADQSKITAWQGWKFDDPIDTTKSEGQLLAATVLNVSQLLLGNVDSVSFVHATQGECHICRVPAHPTLFVVTTEENTFAAGLTNMLYALIETALNAFARGQIRPDEIVPLRGRPDGIRGTIDERSDWYAVGGSRYVVVVYDWRQSSLASRLRLYERRGAVYLEASISEDERSQLASLIELKRLSARAAGA